MLKWNNALQCDTKRLRWFVGLQSGQHGRLVEFADSPMDRA